YCVPIFGSRSSGRMCGASSSACVLDTRAHCQGSQSYTARSPAPRLFFGLKVTSTSLPLTQSGSTQPFLGLTSQLSQQPSTGWLSILRRCWPARFTALLPLNYIDRVLP